MIEIAPDSLVLLASGVISKSFCFGTRVKEKNGMSCEISDFVPTNEHAQR